jgi:hypothetical protein
MMRAAPAPAPRWGAALLAVATAAGLIAGCGGGDDDDGGGVETTLFPADYADSYQEVRNCRKSGDHDLNNVRVLADPAALTPYQNRVDAFPEGAVVIKEEYDFADDTCSGDLVQWTVMSKLAEGAAPDFLDWHWQTVDPERKVADDNLVSCAGCHTDCGVPPVGYAGTCAQPP